MIENLIGVKNSIRNINEEAFEDIVDIFAYELSKLSFYHSYNSSILRKDWDLLKDFTCGGFYTSSVSRRGMKLCETFFPNFFHIKNNKGKSFADFWNPIDLQKVLRWNRKSHSTPYMSELRRGVYFCNGLTKNTMYRPHIAKMICDYYKPESVLDPCAGWGGRMLGSLAYGASYTAFETNEDTCYGLKKLADFIDEEVSIFNEPAENMDEFINEIKYDLVITSPPYFNLEIYSDNKKQSENKFKTYEKWKEEWLKVVIKKSISHLKDDGVSCWNVHNLNKMPMIEDVRVIHEELGFVEDKIFGLTSSARQANQNIDKNKKTNDLTICYKRG